MTATATPLPELEHRQLIKKTDWLGGYVRVHRMMFNGLVRIPAHFICHVRGNRGGLSLNTQACDECGLFVDILPVRETEVEYLGHPRMNRQIHEPAAADTPSDLFEAPRGQSEAKAQGVAAPVNGQTHSPSRTLHAGDGLSDQALAAIAREIAEWDNTPLTIRALRRKSDWAGAHVRLLIALKPHEDARGFWREGMRGKVQRPIRGGRLLVHSIACMRCGVSAVSNRIAENAVHYLGHPVGA